MFFLGFFVNLFNVSILTSLFNFNKKFVFIIDLSPILDRWNFFLSSLNVQMSKIFWVVDGSKAAKLMWSIEVQDRMPEGLVLQNCRLFLVSIETFKFILCSKLGKMDIGLPRFFLKSVIEVLRDVSVVVPPRFVATRIEVKVKNFRQFKLFTSRSIICCYIVMNCVCSFLLPGTPLPSPCFSSSSACSS